ncbi:MAG: hypothetical protein J6T98_05920 [Salinivirgaceae bacterium]|nr:hypothetical protein [Salinivirgaceae bacterium]
MDSFTSRNHINIEPIPITIRFEAPSQLRCWLFELVKSLGFSIKAFRGIICQYSYQSADPNNWDENSFMESEIMFLLENCQWNFIYDIIEATFEKLPQQYRQPFSDSINNFFISNGYGWKLEDGQILSRGDDTFEQSIKSAVECVKDTNPDAFSEIMESIVDISKRPEPDVTGAVQHSMAALECFCRSIFGNEKKTLGELINSYRDEIPKPLDTVMEKLWGFSSEQGRHLNEGKTPAFEEAELTVHICAALITYFKKKN